MGRGPLFLHHLLGLSSHSDRNKLIKDQLDSHEHGISEALRLLPGHATGSCRAFRDPVWPQRYD